MMNVYDSDPKFVEKYGDDRGISSRLQKIFYNTTTCGGVFYKPLQYINGPQVQVPDIRADMEKMKLDVLGFFHLKKLQLKDDNRQSFFEA